MRFKILLAAAGIFISTLVAAQDKIRISGNVQDEKKQPFEGVAVMVKGTNIGTVTDASGNYTLEVPKDAKTLVFSYTGYASKEFPINPNQGNYVLNVDFEESGVGLNQVIVSASRKREKLLDAPASVSVLGTERIERNVVTTPVEQLKTTPGVDLMRTGLISSNVVIRGFNNIFSGSVFNVVDNRIGSVPSLRVNAYQLVPLSNLDYEKIEVVRGPASALYGPNASSGVIHIMTKSPLEQKKKFETSVAMTTGFTVLDKSVQQLNIGQHGDQTFTGNPNPDNIIGQTKRKIFSGNIINPELRHSGRLFDGKFGYKVSGSYFQALDYPNYDPREPFDGDSLLFGSVINGQIFRPDTLGYETDANGNIIDSTLRLNIKRFQKDFRIRKYTADARIDIRPINDITIIVNGGLAGSRNIELTGLGAAAAGGPTGAWIYWYFQTRFMWKNLFIQYFLNSSDAGNTFLIPQLSQSARNDYHAVSPPRPYKVQRLVDQSKLHVIQAQHSINPLEKLNLIYGFDVFMTRPDTKGTINGRFETRDNLTQIGGYFQAEYEPLKWLKAVSAFRIDYNNIIGPKGTAFSPRGALVFKPAQGHNIRITFNRAFDSPTTLNQFLDLSNGLIPNGINVRGIGNPYGWRYNFATDANGNRIVQFKTAPWGGTQGQWVTFGDKSINVAMFDSLKNYLISNFAKATGNIFIATSLVNAILDGIAGPGGTVANAEQISIDYANFAQTKDLASSIQDVKRFEDLKKINNSNTQTLELGYKGFLFNKLSLQTDIYWTRISNYVSPLRSASGAVVLDAKSYLGGYDYANNRIDTNGVLYQNLYVKNGDMNSLLVGVLDGVPALQNPSIVPSIQGSVWDELVVMTYQFPLGTITPDDSSLINSDYILTFKNLGRLDVFGLDFGFQYNAIEDNRQLLQAGGSLSWVNKDQLTLSSGERVPLNAPKLKSSVMLDYTMKNIGLSVGTTFRYQMGFEAASAVYSGFVKPAYLLDARISYRPKFYEGLLLSVNINNVTNYMWRSFPGTPLMGTQLFARAQVSF
ncbi:MAG: TonB-dependent receptor [Chitinophagales bacterium]|nr:TonB-dependent receptor [Chitinophagales bacterium]MDW8419047.1 TonB-dependent receptor [Chitinophagales bacterium]